MRLLPTTSSSTFRKGSLVALSTARNVRLYDSADSGYLGIAMNASVDSLPAGKVLVAIPRPGCTAYADCFTGMATSVVSIGQAMGLCVGNQSGDSTYLSFITTLATSVFSRIATIVGPVDSANSRVEIAFVQNEATFYSTSSVSLA
jgi:hypothetical protein